VEGARSADHSADPTQPEEGFDVGARTEPPDTEVGRFDSGIADTQAPESQREGRFDEGVADTDAPDKQREGRFDDGSAA
jgi:hypothetical protein